MKQVTKFLYWSSQAGASALGSLLAIFIVGGVAAVLGLAIDRSQVFFKGLSADASNTIYTLEIAFSASVIIFLVAVIINHWLSEKSDANQGV